MKLYFRRYNGEFIYVCDAEGLSQNAIMSAVFEDIKRHNPNYKSFYQRIWTDEQSWTWIDVGSWSEFYVIRPEIKEDVA